LSSIFLKTKILVLRTTSLQPVIFSSITRCDMLVINGSCYLGRKLVLMMNNVCCFGCSWSMPDMLVYHLWGKSFCLRRGLDVAHLADMFSVSPSTISRAFILWLSLSFYKLSFLIRWPSKEQVRHKQPACFKYFPHTRCVIDCTEFYAFSGLVCPLPSEGLGALTKAITHSNVWYQ